VPLRDLCLMANHSDGRRTAVWRVVVHQSGRSVPRSVSAKPGKPAESRYVARVFRETGCPSLGCRHEAMKASLANLSNSGVNRLENESQVVLSQISA